MENYQFCGISINCGKTFLLKPLSLVYRSFVNPATSTFAWVGTEQAELLFRNDFRWSPQVIPWHDLLLLLKGEPIHNYINQLLRLPLLKHTRKHTHTYTHTHTRTNNRSRQLLSQRPPHQRLQGP